MFLGFLDGVPPMVQQRQPPAALQGFSVTPAPVRSYRYVILNLWFITITRRSISLGIAAASLTFVALQVRRGLCSVSGTSEPS